MSTTPATLLLVDDVAASRQTLANLLESPELRLLEAPDGLTALRLALASPPDLVLLDVMMPGIDGFEVCRRIRADPRLAEVPVVIVTALDDQASRLAGIEAGADDFVSKPFERAELRARVHTITRLNRYRRLHEQRAQFQWIVDQADDGYVLVDDADAIQFANPRARQWLDLPADLPASGNGSPPGFLASARRLYLPQPTEAWHEWPPRDTPAAGPGRLLVRPETRQARALFLEVTLFTGGDRRLLRLRDVSERLAGQRDQRSFHTMVSHKLRTPLNAIVGGLETLADPAGLGPAELSDFAAIAREGAAQLTAVVDDVLRFAALSRPESAAFLCPVAELETVVHAVAASLGLGGVQVTVAPAVSTAALPCDRATLTWVLTELLDNARKFHPRRAPAITVAAQATRDGALVLTVADDGVSIPIERLARIGQPYFQGEKNFTGEIPGLGLGLASVFTLAWQAGGSARIANRAPGPGVVVELRWPPARAAVEQPAFSSHS